MMLCKWEKLPQQLRTEAVRPYYEQLKKRQLSLFFKRAFDLVVSAVLLLLLSPVAVKTPFQRQHISKELIEYGFEKARALGYKAVIVEGNPMNYRSRGFATSAPYGINAHESVGLPAPECLMVKELVPGGLNGIHGQVCYSDYECLR